MLKGGSKIEGYVVEIEKDRILVVENITIDKYEQLRYKSIKELMEQEETEMEVCPLETLIAIMFLILTVLIIVISKYKDIKKKKEHPPKQWEGKPQREMEDQKERGEKLTEFQKGNGRGGGGGPF